MRKRDVGREALCHDVLVVDEVGMYDGRWRCRADELVVGAMKAAVELSRRASRGIVVALRGAMITNVLFASGDVKIAMILDELRYCGVCAPLMDC